MKGNVVVFPVSSERVSVSDELAILKAQDLMTNAIFGADDSEDGKGQNDTVYLMTDEPRNPH